MSAVKHWQEQWRSFGSGRRNRRAFAVSAAVLAASVALIRWTITRIEARRGVELPDLLLASFPPVDFTGSIFVLIYGTVLLAVGGLAGRPRQFLVTLQAYALLLMLRSLTLWLVPLEPPADMIVLHDPVVQAFLPHSDHPPTRDLFFSGHVATAFLFFLTAGPVWMKTVLAGAALLTGVLLALQHVHYSIDLIAAPFFALGSYRAVLRFQPLAQDLEGGTPIDTTNRASR